METEGRLAFRYGAFQPAGGTRNGQRLGQAAGMAEQNLPGDMEPEGKGVGHQGEAEHARHLAAAVGLFPDMKKGDADNDQIGRHL